MCPNPGFADCNLVHSDQCETNILTNSQHCGACDIVCATGAMCIDGVCQCRTGQTACSGVCVNTQTDNANCGICGNTCGQGSNPTGSTCQSGACKCPSGQFLNSAGNACVATCGTNEVVNANIQCTACPSGTTAQNGQCVDPPQTKVCTSQGCVGSNVNCPVDSSDPTGPTVCKPITQCDFCKIP
jgi:hypothetical protein